MPAEALVLSRDHAVIRHLRQSLSELGLAVEVATGSQQATAELARRSFDAILIDCDDVHGALDTLKAAATHGSAKVVAIVNGVTSVEEARQMGATGVVRKPLPADVIEKLRSALKG